MVLFRVLICFSISIELINSHNLCVDKRNPNDLRGSVSDFFIKWIKKANLQEDIKFYLYTIKNKSQWQVLELWNVTSVKLSNFNPNKPVRFIIHGWQSSASAAVNVLIRNAYLLRWDLNVIVVDWSVMARTITYIRSIYWLEPVSKVIANFTKFLNQEFYVNYKNIYLVGHSLGAHLSGLVGRQVKPNLFDTIYGLDPAGPGFDSYDGLKELALKAGDAYYVETIQTNIKLFGYYGKLGNCSVFPAYGDSEKGHSGAIDYFTRSILYPDNFKAIPCDDFININNKHCICASKPHCFLGPIQVGSEPSIKKSGIYYVNVP